ncbi:cytochrome c peroxidase [Caulifigura coniformis]|uniref:cytochrome c peroxidase n=1 Tax=Caulifigura coniformis TaxID=2527983 RepID=UPI001E3E6694|nr:cytochrome c peroxidase [Caulifigura coniformis]
MLALAICVSRPILAQTPQELGEQLFRQAFPGTNGRSCATCHVPENDFTLTPAHVESLWKSNPNDPLFNAIDADDPDARKLTFNHLRKGLVRVWITLPDNVDIIDYLGNVTTPRDRRLFVWRSVPSIRDSAMTAPFQLDGRVATLEEQAQHAITDHSQGGTISRADLEHLAAFERSIFSSDRARRAATTLSAGGSHETAAQVDEGLQLTSAEERGREVFKKVCAVCHGGGAMTTIVDRRIHDLSFSSLRPNGTVVYQIPATDPPTPVPSHQPTNEFINIGSAYEAFMAGLDPDSQSFTKSVSFPHYRYRFYTDGTRTKKVADLPPQPASFNPFSNKKDGDGNPITGPNIAMQLYSTDPGRAMITGSPYDFEAFDIPSLRGISRTAPYFHNNTAEKLEDVVELYSDHFMARFPPLSISDGPPEPDADGDAGPPEAPSAQQKKDLVAYLKRL